MSDRVVMRECFDLPADFDCDVCEYADAGIQGDYAPCGQQNCEADYTPFEFEYQGYHFEAVGVLPQGLEGKELINQTRGNTELQMTTYDSLYSYAEFYKASGSPEADIFRCMETGRNYIPGENELFGYEGEFFPYRQNE